MHFSKSALHNLFSKNNLQLILPVTMVRSKATIIKFTTWILFLTTIKAFNLPQSSKYDSYKILRFAADLPKARSLYEQYTLGQTEEGAKIIYTYTFTQQFDEEQPEIALDFHYPDDTTENVGDDIAGDSLIITQIQLYVKADDGATTQAYITEGGIGKNAIALQIIANHSNLLNYMLVIYGKAE